MGNTSEWHQLITAIHSSGCQIVSAITGGGSQAIGELLAIPGGSNSLLEAVIPYSSSALADWLGGVPDQACSEPTARAMAMVAWVRAKTLAASSDPAILVGVGVSASIVSDTPKKGEHRIHVGVQTSTQTTSYSLTLAKGQRDRSQEELLAVRLSLLALAEICGVDVTGTWKLVDGELLHGEKVLTHKQTAEADWTQLLLGERQLVQWPHESGKQLPKAIFPGAFRPLHHGHRRMAEIAAEVTQSEVAYELSITNVDKPPLDYVEIAERLSGIETNDPGSSILLTTTPTFSEKATLFPGCTFVVGADTLQRIADPCYYGDSEQHRDAAINQIAQAKCSFLVFGRQVHSQYCTLSNLQLPPDLLQLCKAVPASEFREDVSSTELRKSS